MCGIIGVLKSTYQLQTDQQQQLRFHRNKNFHLKAYFDRKVAVNPIWPTNRLWIELIHVISLLKDDLAHLKIPHEYILSATNNFGTEGVFYQEYMGQLSLSDDLIDIYARRFEREKEQEFWMEVSLLSNLKHKNLVSFVGFCDENDEKIIITRRETRGMLYGYLSDPMLLTWVRRLEISVGIAQVLSYIHYDESRNFSVIHRYISRYTVELNDEWEPKLSKFEYSMKIQASQRHHSFHTNTPKYVEGYGDPTYIETKSVNHKSDVYSFGIVMFELLCGKAVIQDDRDNKYLASVAVTLSYECLNEERSQRPNIDEIVTRLEKALELQLELPNAISLLKDDLAHLKIPLEKILSATNNFDRYEGQLSWSDDLIDIYARRLKKIKEQEFWMEVSLLSSLKHKNLVSFVGFCDENDEKVIITTRETRGSLDRYLRDPMMLTWVRRLEISVGIAQALSYIHYDESRDFSITHRNISSKAVQLNNDWEPKLSKFQHSLKTKASERHHSFHTDSVWSDIYSFGIVLFELLCGRESVIDDQDNKYLAPVAIFHHREKILDEIINPDLRKQMDPLSLNIFAETAYKCLSKEQSQSPNMDQIVTSLEKALELQLGCENADVGFVIDNVTGTIGYLDPLHSKTGFLTKESDIFSLGAVLFDILCGKLSSVKLDDEYLYLPFLAKHHYQVGKLDELVFEGIKEQIETQSFITFARIAYRCIHHRRERQPTANEVVIQLKKALEFQENYEKWEPKLPTDYKEIIQMSKCPEIYYTKKKEELYNIFCKGILLQQDKVLLSFVGNGERNEMVSATTFSYINSCPHEWKSLPESRRERQPTANEVVIQLKKALEFQENYEKWEPKLPTDYKEIIQMSKCPEIYYTKKKEELYNIFCKGILLQQDKVLLSFVGNGERNEMVSATTFSYINSCPHEWKSLPESRFETVAKMLDTSNLIIEIKTRAQFLSPNVVYGVYLVFKFCDSRNFSSEPVYVKLKYRKGPKSLHAYFATWRDEQWMMIELHRFLKQNQDVVFEFLLESFSSYYCGDVAVYVEGIEFRAIDKVKHEEIGKLKEVQQVLTSDFNTDQVQQLPTNLEEIFKVCRNYDELFWLGEVNGKKLLVLSAKASLYKFSNADTFTSKPPAQSRFQEVIELLPQQVFHINCTIKSQMLSSDTEYVCYLLFNLSENCQGMHCPVKVRDELHQENKEAEFVYFITPEPSNIHDITRLPKQREDGWMEIQLWRFNSAHEFKDDSLSINMKFTTNLDKLVALEVMIMGTFFKTVQGLRRSLVLDSSKTESDKCYLERSCTKHELYMTGELDFRDIVRNERILRYQSASGLVSKLFIDQHCNQRQSSIRWSVTHGFVLDERGLKMSRSLGKVNKASETAHFSKLIGSSLKVKVYLHSFDDNLAARIRNICEAKVDTMLTH
ncbi:protein kinase-like domain, Phloem protein 2-like protein [Artemisia annua]|uniref:Protein kinase-like domain, Phloem protein 2-like protein n=1 Tax=Artemisia annua TaxID=35608 RepID=A0A2U1LC94_ARTAN|nr:protein kinase-like domain, Phloem protein 2-like protein [Artemisia annua]